MYTTLFIFNLFQTLNCLSITAHDGSFPKRYYGKKKIQLIINSYTIFFFLVTLLVACANHFAATVDIS